MKITLYMPDGTSIDYLSENYGLTEGILTFVTITGGTKKQVRTTLPFLLETEVK
jgi:hypothetical protein